MVGASTKEGVEERSRVTVVESPLKASPLEMGAIINICPRTQFLCPVRPKFKLTLCQNIEKS